MAVNCLVTYGADTRVIAMQQGRLGEMIPKLQTLFNIPPNYIIKLKRFSDDWQEWINVEPLELKNRDKVRVETCMSLLDLTMETSSTTDDADVSVFTDDSGCLPQNIFEESDESDKGWVDVESASSTEGQAQQSQQRKREAEIESQPTPPSKKPANKINVPFKPWPVTINIPESNMSPTLRATLKQGIFPSDKLRKQLIQMLFDYMWQFGSHPSRYHYEIVAQQLVKDYPCLAQTSVPSAKPYDYWKMKLSDKFRNERKSSRVRGTVQDLGGKNQKPQESAANRPLAGEDDDSIRMHMKWMQDESRKKTPDRKRVKKLMDITFKHRREDVDKKMLVPQLEEKYPFLFTAAEIHNEFQRMTGIEAVATISENLKPFIEPIWGYVFPGDQKEAEQFRKRAAESVTLQNAEEIKATAALYLLPSVLKKNRSEVMGQPKTPENMDAVSPYLEIESTVFDTNKPFTIRAEKRVIARATSFLEGVALLLETYYVFSMQYPKSAKDMFNFLESCLMRMEAVKPSRCVSSALIKLKACEK